MFNDVLENEKVPEQWAICKLFLILKKGDTKNPNNYRRVSLLNTKVFTYMVSQQLIMWAEECNILPENQAGFKKGKGCQDNIFILSTLINSQIASKRGKLYAAFIDFQKTFDNVDHTLLWKKLFSLGISRKLIAFIQNLYEKAQFILDLNPKTQFTVKVARGVMQGDSLSPLLFILFISDMNKFFVENNVRNVSLSHQNEISHLLYADDTTLCASSPLNLQFNLNILYKYCQTNRLAINYERQKL